MGELLRQDDARGRLYLAHDTLGEALVRGDYGGAGGVKAGQGWG